MARVLIIGAGGVGSVVTHKCAQNPLFQTICLASRTKSKCDAIAAQIKRPIQTAQIDADNIPQTIALIKKIQPHILINVALPYQDLNLMEACLQTHTHYLDTANYEPRDQAKFSYDYQWPYHDRFKNIGKTALLGSGFDPGVTNLFCAYAQKHHFDQIHYIDILDCNDGNHGLPFATNFNPEINLREITAPGRYWENGKWITIDPLSIHKTHTFQQIGPKEIYLIYHEEIESLIKHIHGLKRIRFWMTFSQQYLTHLNVLQNIGMTSIQPINVQGQQIAPIEFLQALLPDPASLGPLTKGKTNIGCIIQGIQNRQPKKIHIYNICDHQNCYAEVQSQAISYTTGVPAMIGAHLIANRTWTQPGVWNIEQLDPDPFMKLLPQYGLPWHITELK